MFDYAFLFHVSFSSILPVISYRSSSRLFGCCWVDVDIYQSHERLRSGLIGRVPKGKGQFNVLIRKVLVLGEFK